MPNPSPVRRAPVRAPSVAHRPHAPQAHGRAHPIKHQLRGASFAAGEAMLSPNGAPDGLDPLALLAQMPRLDAALAVGPPPEAEAAGAEAPAAAEAGVDGAEGAAEANEDMAELMQPEPAADLEAPGGGDGGEDAAVEEAPDGGEKAAPAEDVGAPAAAAGPATITDDAGGVSAPAPATEAGAGGAASADQGGAAPAPSCPEHGGAAPAPRAMAGAGAAGPAPTGPAPEAAEADAPVGAAASAQAEEAAPEAVAAGDERAAPPAPGGGAPLPEAAREQLEADTGVELADVRVHQGGEVGNAISSTGARAAAMGKDIVFTGAMDLRSPETLHVLRHEIAHLVQQAEGKADALGPAGVEGGQRDALERDAEQTARGQGAPRRHPGAHRDGPPGRGRRRKVAFKQRGPAQYFGMPSIPNPISVAKKAGSAAVHGAKAAGKKAVKGVKSAGHAVARGAKKVAGWARSAITAGIDRVMGWANKLLDALTNVADLIKTFAHWAAKWGPLKDAAKKLERAVDTAKKAKDDIETALKRAKQAVTIAKKLYAYAKQFRKRGPAYYAAAKQAVVRIVGTITDPGAMLSAGMQAVREAVASVAAQARATWQKAKKGMRSSFRSLGAGLKTIGGSIKRAGQWMWARRKGFQKIFEGVTELAALLPPPVGPIAGLANALSHAARGDWKGAAMGLVSAIPLVGAAARAGQYGTRAAGAVVKIDRAIERSRGAAKVLAKSAGARMKGIKRAWQRSQQQLATGVGRVRRQLATRFAGITDRYYDYRTKLAAYHRQVGQTIANYKQRYQPWLDRYNKWNDRISTAEELYGKIQSAGGSILDGWEDVQNPEQPATAGGGGGGGAY